MIPRIRYVRNRENLTQTEFGKIIGLNYANISKYESGQLEPNLKVICKIAKEFNVSADFLLGLTDVETPMVQSDIKNDFVEFRHSSGEKTRIEIPNEYTIRFRLLLEAGLPELFKNHALN